MFWSLSYIPRDFNTGTIAFNDQQGGVIVFRGIRRETPHLRQKKKWGEDSENKNEVEWTGKVEISMVEFLVAGEGDKATVLPNRSRL